MIHATTLAVLAALVGCSAEADPMPELGATVTAMRQRMHRRFVSMEVARVAVAHGELEVVHAQARMVAAQAEPDIVPEWKPYVASVQREALQLAATKDIVAAAKGIAAVGRQCAACHASVPAKIVFDTIPTPRPATNLASAMAEHEWATALLWEGLIGPAPERWTAGAAMLERARLTIVAGGPAHLGIDDDIARVRTLATKARAAKTTDERAQLYSDILVNCVRCHAAIRDR